ncbi:transposase [Streptomyces sp. NBC_00250]|uniref:transposase n=1 Tax=Streptomyces sp. NBC_00250 TaxID=2903641 RepID=UPI003FA7F030
MGGDLSQRLVPDDLWTMGEPVLPSFRSRPQGGGVTPIDQRAVFTAVVYVLTSGCAWRYQAPTFGVSPATAHRRFSVWTTSGVRRQLHRVVLDEIGARGGLDGSSVIDDAASVRAKRGSAGGAESGRPGKTGSKLHDLTDVQGLPVVVGVSAANVNDVQALRPPTHPGRPLTPRPPSAAPRQGQGRQGLPLGRQPGLATRTQHHPTDRPAWQGVLRTPRKAPMEDREADLLAVRNPTPAAARSPLS